MSVLSKISGNWSVSRKLTVLSGLFLVPIALLSWLLIAQSNKDVDFSAKESAGVAYLSGASWPLFVDLVSRSLTGESKTLAEALQNLENYRLRFDKEMDSADASAALIEKAGALSPTSSAGEAVDVIAASRTLLTKIADHSNLTLDPDLDTYYTQDLVTVKLPDFLDLSAALVRLAREDQQKESLTTQEKAAFLILSGQMMGAYAGATSDMQAAVNGNLDGTLAPVFGALQADLTRSADLFAAQAQQLGQHFAQENPGAADLTALVQTQKELGERINVLHQKASAELDRLLQIRIKGFEEKLTASLLVTFFVVVLAWGFSRLLSRGIMRVINGFATGIDHLAEGGGEVEIPYLNRKDEFSLIAQALDRFREKTIEKTKAESTRQQVLLRAHEIETLRRMSSELESAVGGVVSRLGVAVTAMHGDSETVANNARKTGRSASSVNDQTNLAASNLQTVASAAEELSASINEISGNISNAASVAQAAWSKTEGTKDKVSHLSEMTNQIGNIVTLINDIASQTNLLALNATIEAARAGEAGKGFAVVAGEVKSLATQTSRATEEITAQINDVQLATRETVQAMGEIAATVQEVLEISTAISAAIEEQSAATGEISRSIQTATDSASVVVTGVGELEQVAHEAEDAAHSIKTSTDDLKAQSDFLKNSLDNFIASIAKATAEGAA